LLRRHAVLLVELPGQRAGGRGGGAVLAAHHGGVPEGLAAAAAAAARGCRDDRGAAPRTPGGAAGLGAVPDRLAADLRDRAALHPQVPAVPLAELAHACPAQR